MVENAASPAVNPQSNGATPPAPANDSISIPRSEYETYVRNQDRLKGADAYYAKGKALGFNRAEDFDAFKPKYDTLTNLEKKGFTTDRLGRLISDEADDDLKNQPEDRQTKFDPEAFKKEMYAEFEKRSELSKWQDLSKAEKQHIDEALRAVLGDEQVDDMSKSVYRLAVEQHMNTLREPYPDGHPLRGEVFYQPLTASHAQKAIEYFKAEKAKYAGAAMANKADNAIKGEKKSPSSSAGKSGGNGAPDKSNTRRPGGLPAREEVEAQYKARLAKRGSD